MKTNNRLLESSAPLREKRGSAFKGQAGGWGQARPNAPPQAAPPHNYGYGAPAGVPQQTGPHHNYGYGAPGAPPPYAPGAPPPRGAPPGAPPYASGAPPHTGAPPGAPPYSQGGGPPSYAPGYGGYGGAPPQAAYGPPPGISHELWNWFQSVDQDRSGQITAIELQRALVNGNWTPFNEETCRLMIGMFDKDRSGTIDIHEFSALWNYIQSWKSCFDRFDTDRSGNIDVNELHNAFRTFGYNLSPQFCQVVIQVFGRKERRANINFDDFIQSCVMLKSLTDKFRVKDVNQTGNIRIQYEEFLEMALDNTLA